MKAIVSNPGGPVITAVDDPHPGSGEALVAIQAFSVNRGELDLLRTRTNGCNTEKTPVSIYDFFGHEGARLVSYLSYAYPEPPGPDLATLAGLVAAGRLDPAVGLTLPWTRLRDALAALAGRRISGKAVLTIGCGAQGVGEAGGWLGERMREPGQDDAPLFL